MDERAPIDMISEERRTDDDVAALFAREHRPMTRLATLMVSSPAVAEEIVQDAFVAVRERWASLDRPGAYLRATVVNGCAQSLRRRDLERRHADLEPPPSLAESPTHLIELRDALDRLTDRQRMVIVLRYFLDLPDGEIAELIEARPSTVRSLARRALAVLREELT